jgi:hypothetical protein
MFSCGSRQSVHLTRLRHASAWSLTPVRLPYWTRPWRARARPWLEVAHGRPPGCFPPHCETACIGRPRRCFSRLRLPASGAAGARSSNSSGQSSGLTRSTMVAGGYYWRAPRSSVGPILWPWSTPRWPSGWIPRQENASSYWPVHSTGLVPGTALPLSISGRRTVYPK